jgi:predicted metal-dependent hydrolase
MSAMKYLSGYAPAVLARVCELIAQGRLGESVRQRYPEANEVRNDPALYDYVMALKTRYMRSAPPIAKVAYDNRLQVLHNALGTHATVSRVQGTRLKSKREIRVANLFKEAPGAFLKMIVVHELAHLKEREHDKPFYALCCHMESDYHQLEFDLRLWLTAQELEGPVSAGAGCIAPTAPNRSPLKDCA